VAGLLYNRLMNIFRVGDTFGYLGPIKSVSPGGVEIPYDFTGWGVAATLVRQGAAGASLPLLASFSDPGTGVVAVTRASTDTAAWPTGEYAMVLRLTSPAGAVISGGNVLFRLTR